MALDVRAMVAGSMAADAAPKPMGRPHKPVLDMDTGEEWVSVNDCAAFLGVTPAAVSKAALGHQPTCRGRRLTHGGAR